MTRSWPTVVPDPQPEVTEASKEWAAGYVACQRTHCANVGVPARRLSWHIPLCLECCPVDPPEVVTWADLDLAPEEEG